jgi:hypothetical protein
VSDASIFIVYVSEQPIQKGSFCCVGGSGARLCGGETAADAAGVNEREHERSCTPPPRLLRCSPNGAQRNSGVPRIQSANKKYGITMIIELLL